MDTADSNKVALPKLWGISGRAGVGKDAVATFILKHTSVFSEEAGYQYIGNYEVKKFAAKLKQIAGILTGVNTHDFESQEFKKQLIGPDWGDLTYRKLLQVLGTEGIRDALHENAWVNALFADFVKDESHWVISDCRFPNEAQAIKDRGGIVIRVERPGLDSKDTHPTETALDDWEFDHVIVNDGDLAELEEKVMTLLNELQEGNMQQVW